MRNDEHEEKSWSRDLIEGYRQAILDYQCQVIMNDLYRIDEFIDFMDGEYPHAESICKRILYNVKKQERYEREKGRGKNPKDL